MGANCSHTFSVIGKSKSTAQTGLGTKLRTSASKPYTSPNCQVGTKPSCRKNLTKGITQHIHVKTKSYIIRLVNRLEEYGERHTRAYAFQKRFYLNISTINQ